MDVFYKREMKHNYMIIKPDQWEEGRYESRMMIGNHIEGLLRFRLKQLDQEVYFCYEITSRQPLSRLLETYSVKAEDLKNLIFSIAAALDRMETYLLKEEQIWLEPEYVYVEPESFQAALCLIPGRNGNFSEDLGRLLQFILKKINHQDHEVVLLAYGLFQESQKENYTISDLLNQMTKKEGDLKEERQKSPEPVFAETEQEETLCDGKAPAKEKRLPKLPALVLILGGLLVLWLLRGMDGLRTYGWAPFAAGAGALLWNLLTDREEKAFLKESDLWKKSWEDDIPEPTVREPGISGEESDRHFSVPPLPEPFLGDGTRQTEPAVCGADTVLLADLEETGRCRLIFMNQELGTMEIPYFPFVLGKQELIADGVIPRETVSRFHMRLEQTETGYLLTDLNSTNGTRVNGRLLETNETVSIVPGDQIYAADVGFLFTK